MAAKASYRTSIALLVSCLVSATIAKNGIRYTVWSSVIFSRTGERTPEVLGYDPVTLTSVGAQQQYSAGQYFRQRYLESYNNFTTNNGIDLAPMPGMSPEIPDVQKLYVQALDEQYSVASAQAFLQGLYPPVSFTSNSSELQTIIDPTALLANNTYVSVSVRLCVLFSPILPTGCSSSRRLSVCTNPQLWHVRSKLRVCLWQSGVSSLYTGS